MNPSPSIAIVGAGPSGLVFAQPLEVHGITDYVVFERTHRLLQVPGNREALSTSMDHRVKRH
jgi:cation diffusion facilitator CzcD-associated flavoprotein CzcO